MARKILHGTVVSAKNDKTIIIKVIRMFQHPRYGKFIRRSERYAAHDPNNSCKEGDMVKIRESRPFSRTKRWELINAE